jgi:hypothetical protein
VRSKKRSHEMSAKLQIGSFLSAPWVKVLSFFGFAAREGGQRKGLRPILFNPCSAPATPVQTLIE